MAPLRHYVLAPSALLSSTIDVELLTEIIKIGRLSVWNLACHRDLAIAEPDNSGLFILNQLS